MKNPLLLLTGGIIIGIIAASCQMEWLPPLFLAFAGLSLFLYFRNLIPKFSYQTALPGISFLLIAAVLGFGLMKMNQFRGSHHIENQMGIFGEWEGIVTQASKPVKHGHYTFVSGLKSADSEWGGGVILYTGDAERFQVGQPVKFKGKFRQVPENGFGNWLKSRDVFVQCNAQSIESIGEPRGFWAFFGDLRAKMAEKIREMLPGETGALALAVLLGEKSDLDSDTKAAFSAAGISHFLAISGMHVMAIFLMLQMALKTLYLGRRTIWIRNGAILGILIFYACLTGGNTAVVRAVFMIGIHLMAQAFHLQVQKFNLLATAALVLLLLRPSTLFDAGFQLSFAAVAGIFLLSGKIAHVLQNDFSRIPEKVRNGISISLAAQLFTAPFILYHFGAFPTWFLVANIAILVPGAFAVNFGFVGLLLLWVPGLNHAIWFLTDAFFASILRISKFVSGLPAAQVRSFSFSDPGFSALFLMIAAVFGWMAFKRFRAKTWPLALPKLNLQIQNLG